MICFTRKKYLTLKAPYAFYFNISKEIYFLLLTRCCEEFKSQASDEQNKSHISWEIPSVFYL